MASYCMSEHPGI